MFWGEEPSGASRGNARTRSKAVNLSKGFHFARQDVDPQRSLVVYPGQERYSLGGGIEAIPLKTLARELADWESQVTLSPVAGRLEPRALAEWILDARVNVRLGLQLHRLLWPDEPRGR